MRNVISFIIIMIFASWQANAQTLANGDFSNSTCSAFWNNCVSDWAQSHGSPDRAGSTNTFAWMWSYDGRGEGIVADYDFAANTCYNISFRIHTDDKNTGDPNVANFARVNIVAANGIPSGTTTSTTIPSPTTSEMIFTDVMGPYLNSWNTISLTYTPSSNFGQLWIYPRMTQDNGQSQSELSIDDIVITPVIGVSAFHFEDVAGTTQTQFTCGQDVYMDGSASQNEANYFIDAWRRPIGSTGSFQYAAGLGWTTGQQVGTLNLSQLFANQGHTFASGYEYQIKLAVQNIPCFNWVPSLQNFTVTDGAYDPNFALSLSSDFSGNVTVHTLANTNSYSMYHWFDVFYAGPNGEVWPYNTEVAGNPTACCSSNTATFNNGLVVNQWYYIKHGIWNECLTWKETRKPFIIRTRRAKTGGKPEYYIEYKEVKFAPSQNYLLEMEEMTDQFLGEEEEVDERGKLNLKPSLEKTTRNETPSFSDITLYPNPSYPSSSITLEAGDNRIAKVELLDITGRSFEVKTIASSAQQVRFELDHQIIPGMYIVRITTEEDEVLLEKLLVK